MNTINQAQEEFIARSAEEAETTTLRQAAINGLAQILQSPLQVLNTDAYLAAVHIVLNDADLASEIIPVRKEKRS
jgi:hypothetical protein